MAAGAARAGGAVLRAPAKVNLHLGVWPGRDERGYHGADSLMVALELHDTVRAWASDGARAQVSAPLGAESRAAGAGGRSCGVPARPGAARAGAKRPDLGHRNLRPEGGAGACMPGVVVESGDSGLPSDARRACRDAPSCAPAPAGRTAGAGAPATAVGTGGHPAAAHGLASPADFAPTGDDLLVTYDPPLDLPAERTAVWRAARGLAAALGRPAAARLHVERRIPSQSGLGSASTDAAAALRALCQLWDVRTDDPRVLAVARGVGADVAFFLRPQPSLLMGVGDVLAETYPPPPPVPVALVRPAAGVSTPEAYAEFDRGAPGPPRSPQALAQALAAGDVAGVARRLYNNLAPAAERLVPEVAQVRTWLAAQPGALAAQVTGSGSCVFALCATTRAAEDAARAAAARGWWSCATTTLAGSGNGDQSGSSVVSVGGISA